MGEIARDPYEEWEIQIICTKIMKICSKTLTNFTHNSTTSRHSLPPPPPLPLPHPQKEIKL